MNLNTNDNCYNVYNDEDYSFLNCNWSWSMIGEYDYYNYYMKITKIH